jgi:hypothetical protein
MYCIKNTHVLLLVRVLSADEVPEVTTHAVMDWPAMSEAAKELVLPLSLKRDYMRIYRLYYTL